MHINSQPSVLFPQQPEYLKKSQLQTKFLATIHKNLCISVPNKAFPVFSRTKFSAKYFLLKHSLLQIMKLTKMPKKHSDVTQRAWSLLRLALPWTRKGGVFKRRLMMELRLVPKFLKCLGHTTAPRQDQISHYKERELSFDETPFFHVKMHRPTSMRFFLPCISAEEVDFDYDFGIDEYDGVYGYDSGRKSYSTGSKPEEEQEQGEEKLCEYEGCDEKSPYPLQEEGIDSKAEKFITEFYEQMKFQRQISYLEFTEMLNRGAG